MKTGIIFFMLCLLTMPATAQAEERIRLPEVQTLEIEGQAMKCFNVEQYKTVILIASEYKGLFEWREKTERTLKLYELQIRAFETQLLHYESIMDIQEKDREYLTNRIDDLIKDRAALKLGSDIEKYILYAVNAALAAGLITLAVKQ